MHIYIYILHLSVYTYAHFSVLTEYGIKSKWYFNRKTFLHFMRITIGLAIY